MIVNRYRSWDPDWQWVQYILLLEHWPDLCISHNHSLLCKTNVYSFWCQQLKWIIELISFPIYPWLYPGYSNDQDSFYLSVKSLMITVSLNVFYIDFVHLRIIFRIICVAIKGLRPSCLYYCWIFTDQSNAEHRSL